MTTISGREDCAPRSFFRTQPSSPMANPRPSATAAQSEAPRPTKRQTFRVTKPHATANARKLDKCGGPRPLRHLKPRSESRFITDDDEMECETKTEIDEILAKTDSIDDLDRDTVAELRATSAGRFSIEKFTVDLDDWSKWSDMHQEVRGIEYDAQNSCVRIKATGSPLHEAATGVVGEWLLGIRDSLRKVTGNRFVCIRSTGVNLSGAYTGSEKVPDEGLSQIGQQFPLIAVEVADSETSRMVFEDAARWLKGSNGLTKLVVVVDIEEKKSRGSTAETTNWGLSMDALGQLELPPLTEHILQWHKDNKSPLVGSFQASFYLCFQNQPPRKVWKCEFSLEEPGSRCFTFEEAGYITTKELIPELDEFHCFPLPLQELSTEMRECLVDQELKRASDKAHKKLKEARKISSQEKIWE